MRLVALWMVAACSGPARSFPTCTTTPRPAPVGQVAASTALPLVVSSQSGGTMRYTLPVTIGSTTLDVFFDTGSSGVRVLAPALADADVTCITSTPATETFHSGLVLDGVLAYASISLGGLSTGPIPIQLVQNGPGEVFGDFQVVFGVGMRTTADAIGNPIAQIAGSPSFAVESPTYGGTSGTLELAPDEQRFATAPLPVATSDPPLANGIVARDDRFGLPACLHDRTDAIDYCAPAELDTGNPPIYIEWAPYSGSTSTLPTGTQVAIDIGPSAAPLGSYSFDVGATPTPGIDKVELEPTTGTSVMNLGTSVFFAYDVLFDQAAGLIGLAPHG